MRGSKSYEVGNWCDKCGAFMRSSYVLCESCSPIAKPRRTGRKNAKILDEPWSQQSAEWLKRRLV